MAVAATASGIASPGGGELISSLIEWSLRVVMIDQATMPKNSGVTILANRAMYLKPKITRPVMAMPAITHHIQDGPPTSAETLLPKIVFWTPNQPTRLTAMTKLTSAEPLRPKPVQRVSIGVARPSRIPARPIAKITISRITAPSVKARKASPKVMPTPMVAPSVNWEIEPDWASHWSSMDQKPKRLSRGTRESE
ncbi:hypothetical protein SPW_7610 [Streptomyces sp. W007]|nr:hypothetical protein SPW_7610 [Streptomyces sp. W007]